ncbi:hypothetical protein, partial [Mesorhizobium sp. M7A.F.Ca.ET.027.02.1.1]|uniref:hypothetical protein n=1 Tax=Mesorhizobium sp. M7A.F.Ca.ET.027.02.1.1 TaxID=2496655 RepID=UPI00167C10A7
APQTATEKTGLGFLSKAGYSAPRGSISDWINNSRKSTPRRRRLSRRWYGTTTNPAFASEIERLWRLDQSHCAGGTEVRGASSDNRHSRPQGK